MIAPFLNQSLPLDIIKDAPPAAAYALRKLKSGYKGAPIRVRRSSDDAELDIPFCGQYLCIGTLIAFVTTNSAYVVTTYDQSGNGNHATQTTAANQPMIVNAGIIDRDFDATKCAALYPTFASASAVNIYTNNFANTTGWSVADATITASSNTGIVTGTGTNNIPRTFLDTGVATIIGKRYFVSLKLRATNANCLSLYAELDGMTAGTNKAIGAIVSNPTINQWYTIQGVIAVGSDFTGNVKILVVSSYVDNATANGKVMEVQEVVCVDVTELGQPCMQAIFASATHFVVADANSLDFTTNASFSIVHNPNSLGESSLGRILEKTSAYIINTEAVASIGTANTLTPSGGGANSISLNAANISTYVHLAGVGTSQYYKNGHVTATVNGNTVATNSNSLYIFNRSALGRQYDGKLSELILFNTTLTDAQRQKLERNQSKYYQVGVA